jgi:hypothetical protein
MFHAWREREHPQAAYLIAAHVWRPEWLVQAEGVREGVRRALKNWEPRITGLAYSDRAIHLVEVVTKLTAEHVGRMLYLADLFRADADYEARPLRQPSTRCAPFFSKLAAKPSFASSITFFRRLRRQSFSDWPSKPYGT